MNLITFKKTKDGLYICPHCDKAFKKRGIYTHIRLTHHENKEEYLKKHGPNKGYYNGTREVWNKGLNKENDNRLKKSSKTWKKRYKDGVYKSFSHKHSQEFKNKMREIAIKRNLGGITQSRWIKYKGKKLGSKYELKVAESLDKNNIKWDTCNFF